MLWLSSDRLDGGRCSSLLADAFTHRKLKDKAKVKINFCAASDRRHEKWWWVSKNRQHQHYFLSSVFFFLTTKPLKILALGYLTLYLKSHLSLPAFICIILIYISFSIFCSHGGYIILWKTNGSQLLIDATCQIWGTGCRAAPAVGCAARLKPPAEGAPPFLAASAIGCSLHSASSDCCCRATCGTKNIQMAESGSVTLRANMKCLYW